MTASRKLPLLEPLTEFFWTSGADGRLRIQGCGACGRLQHPPLDAACARLNALDSGDGRWAVAPALGPFEALPGRPFPVVLSFMQGHGPAASRVAPDTVAAVLVELLHG